jgi:hypothetical protein
MSESDLQAFVETFDRELQSFHPNWQSRIDAGANQKSARLWANGYLLRLDLTEIRLEAGRPGEGSRKYDEFRMVILRDSREPMDEATWTGGSPDVVTVKSWQTVIRDGQTRWRDEGVTEITIEQVFSAVRAAFTRAIEEQNR